MKKSTTVSFPANWQRRQRYDPVITGHGQHICMPSTLMVMGAVIKIKSQIVVEQKSKNDS